MTLAAMSASVSAPVTLLGNALANFDRAAELLKGQFSDDLLAKLRRPKECIELNMDLNFMMARFIQSRHL